MSKAKRVELVGVKTGVPGLDQVMGGDLPEYSFVLIAGPPGSGKTTLAQQIAFAVGTRERPALYFTVLGEPALKVLRYGQQFSFFDQEKLEREVRFVNLSHEIGTGDLGKVLETIESEVRQAHPGIVVVDSFRAVAREAQSSHRDNRLTGFVQRLALLLTSWQTTTFLLGEVSEIGDSEAVETVADAILSLSQPLDRNSAVRKLRITKLRGRAPMPGLHTLRITSDGIEVFPRLSGPVAVGAGEAARWPPVRMKVGVPGLDEMLGGGLVVGDSVLVAGPAGSGKTILSTQFVAIGASGGEASVIAVFEEHPLEYVARAKSLGFDLDTMVEDGKLRILYLRPLDLPVDETLQEIQDAVRKLGAKRVVIDSLSGFELALAPTFRQEFRESLYRMVRALTGVGVTVLMTVEITETFGELRFSEHDISFLTDVIILQRYVEIEARLRRFIAVVKMRFSAHSDELRGYEITPRGMVIGEPFAEYDGLVTGVARRREPTLPHGLSQDEAAVLAAPDFSAEATLADVQDRTGLRKKNAVRALDRLIALHYAAAAREKHRTVYRAIERARGAHGRGEEQYGGGARLGGRTKE